ncbi:hypothetical protein P152DRAFT_458961 [Eremomyces bilateralis CBS 781.70]|uniref:Uncharacterized protein n=1 Tax=Eremomyces bilateralis CBS 781.70 TaxID=1392243 RepID=A0A6G1G1W4_9PEZI|nr:uncharacterized protein P152DRAFT_458961 [Eremomyces bilateralis CBS 781.70]KAF1812008.1 hypothetical protein P152DRAFT_458961 [Eremomyces bilateralis CBS 781.70]
MAYLLYTIAFFTLVCGTALYLTRARWLPLLPTTSHLYTQLPSSFRSDVEAGLHSTNFDLATNIESGDGRSGLDEEGKRAVQKIMRKQKVGFDEARRIFMEQRFKKGGINPDGTPRDPKFVSFS